MASIQSNNLKLIITDPNQTELLVTEADQFGRALKDSGLTTSQIRALFGEVRQIEAMWRTDGMDQKALKRLILLKPKMAYRARKERGRGVEDLIGVLEPALDHVVKETKPEKRSDNFTRFVELFEAILAYHKAAGGN
jgi:CRISPR-associated protein Csm2